MKLHLGCGKRYLEGFYHVDLADYDHIDLEHDIAKLPMFEDDSIELIYCSHALEYYDRQQVIEVLKEWYRILKYGGILRLAVPDFEAWHEVYEQTHNLDNLLGALYGRWQIGNKEEIIYHKTTYDLKSLKKLLENCGFKNVKRWDATKVLPKDYDDFSLSYFKHIRDCKTREEYLSGKLTSLNLECEK